MPYSIETIIVSIIVTLVMYGAFPVSYALIRKKPVSIQTYRAFCIGVTVAVCLVYSTISIVLGDRASRGFPAILWGGIFYAWGKKRLTLKGILFDKKTGNRLYYDQGEKDNWTCSSCGTSNEAEFQFCKKCGKEKGTISFKSPKTREKDDSLESAIDAMIDNAFRTRNALKTSFNYQFTFHDLKDIFFSSEFNENAFDGTWEEVECLISKAVSNCVMRGLIIPEGFHQRLSPTLVISEDGQKKGVVLSLGVAKLECEVNHIGLIIDNGKKCYYTSEYFSSSNDYHLCLEEDGTRFLLDAQTNSRKTFLRAIGVIEKTQLPQKISIGAGPVSAEQGNTVAALAQVVNEKNAAHMSPPRETIIALPVDAPASTNARANPARGNNPNLTYCTECGKEYASHDSRYCAFCGTAFRDDDTEPEKWIAPYCPKCGNKLYPGTLFCDKCGTRAYTAREPRQVCNSCGNALEGQWKYCGFCGQPLISDV